MEGIPTIIFFTLCSFCVIQFVSGLKCYSCGEGSNICPNSPDNYDQIDCSQTGFPTCAKYYAYSPRNKGPWPSNLTRGCGTQSVEGPCEIDFPTPGWTSEVCHCLGDLCNYGNGGYPKGLQCHVCGGSSKRACPFALQKTELVACTNEVVGHRRADGLCHTIRDQNCKVTLACINNKTAEMNVGCKDENGTKVCYCDSDGCNSVLDECSLDTTTDRDRSENVAASVPSISLLQLVLFPLFKLIVAKTTSIGY